METISLDSKKIKITNKDKIFFVEQVSLMVEVISDIQEEGREEKKHILKVTNSAIDRRKTDMPPEIFERVFLKEAKKK